MATKRKGISAKLRFEIFKRDDFKCRYCGKDASNVILHVDHVLPVAEGGTNDIINLITACQDCNLGKGARLLTKNVIKDQQDIQIEEMKAKQEQLKMFLRYRKELIKVNDSIIEQIALVLPQNADISESAKISLLSMVEKYGLNIVVDSVQVSVARGVQGVDFLKYTQKVAYNKYVAQSDPQHAVLTHLLNIIKKRYEVTEDLEIFIRDALIEGVNKSEILYIFNKTYNEQEFVYHLGVEAARQVRYNDYSHDFLLEKQHRKCNNDICTLEELKKYIWASLCVY